MLTTWSEWWANNLCSGNTAATCTARCFLLCAGWRVSVCVCVRLTHRAGGIQYVITGLESDGGGGCAVLRFQPCADVTRLILSLFVGMFVFYCHFISVVAFLPWLCTGGVRGLCSVVSSSRRAPAHTDMHENAHTEALVTEWCTGLPHCKLTPQARKHCSSQEEMCPITHNAPVHDQNPPSRLTFILPLGPTWRKIKMNITSYCRIFRLPLVFWPVEGRIEQEYSFCTGRTLNPFACIFANVLFNMKMQKLFTYLMVLVWYFIVACQTRARAHNFGTIIAAFLNPGVEWGATSFCRPFTLVFVFHTLSSVSQHMDSGVPVMFSRCLGSASALIKTLPLLIRSFSFVV